MDVITAVGTYINVFNDRFDVCIIPNEANDPPKPDEVDAVEKVVEELLNEGCTDESEYCFKLNLLDLNCMCY